MKSTYLINQIVFCIITFLSSASFAFFCPNNLQQIQIGESIDSVIKKCGAPDSKQELKAADNSPQEWIYNLALQQQGSLRMSVIIKENKIINITVNNQSVPNSNLCGAKISIGDTVQKLKDICREPILINKGSQTTNKKPSPMIQFKYNSTPPETLTFKDKKLITRQQGI